jgi:hypothetical protein
MQSHRFGRKLRLPSTAAIKHQLLLMMLEDEIRAIPVDGLFNGDKSAALISLRRLRNRPAHPAVGANE